MKLSSTITLAAAAGAVALNLPNFEQFAIDSGLALAGLNSIALLNSATKYGGGCNLSNVKIRREWRTLPKSQRRAYVKAVQCVMDTPSILAPGVAPGSKSLFDDFVYVHMNSTLFIHFTGNFLIWHRYYIQEYERRLNACGYDGALPYWEWGLDVHDPHSSPVFDGSDTSVGSDGAFIDGPGPEITVPGGTEPIKLRKGTGGGCIYKGPFVNMTVRLGPITQPDPTQENARCLKRDLNADAASRFSSFRNTTDLILNSKTVEFFRTTMEGDPSYVPNSLGVHGGGHFTIAGDPGSDAFISSGDPAFYLHHAQIDRVYWIWQMLDFKNRQDVFGTNTMLNFPPSANTTVEDLIDLSPLTAPVKIKDLMNTIGGTPLCYIYL
ncbi:hypothetical protein VTI74DRAFT_10348 [Chaetomium olivicolor]